MKALFIWNEFSLVAVRKVLKTTGQFGRGNTKFITSKEEFIKLIPHKSNQGLSPNDKLQNTAKRGELKSFSKVYIQAELGWEGGDHYEGYRCGFDLVDRWQGDVPSIHFYSFVSREIIYKDIETEFKFLVKAFSHNNIGKILTEIKYQFPTEAIHKTKWEFFKYMSLTSYGILNDFYHRLESINSTRTLFSESLTTLVNDLKSYPDFIGSGVSSLIETLEFTDAYVQALRLAIYKRIVELSGKQKERLKLPQNLNILVVDDRQEDLDHIKSSLNHYSNHVTYLSNGFEALSLIKKSEFEVAIIDLELLDDAGFYQEVQGVELLEAMWETSGVAGVITGMGTKGISKLLDLPQELVLAKRHLHRFDIDEELDSFLSHLTKAFEKKEKDVIRIENGPQKGFFGLTGFKTSLSKAFSDNEFKQESWAFAKYIAEKFIKNDLTPNHWDKQLVRPQPNDIPSFISQKIGSLLAHRLIMLFLGIKNNGIILKDEEEYYETLKLMKININKSYMSNIGIKYDLENDKGFVLGNNIQDVFSEEIVFIKSLKEELQQEASIFKIKEHHSNTFLWVKEYFDFEDDLNDTIGVPIILGNWILEDLKKAWDFLFHDLSQRKKDSDFKDIIQSIVDGHDLNIEFEVEAAMPDLTKQIEKAELILQSISNEPD